MATVKSTKWGERVPLPTGVPAGAFVVKTTNSSSAGALNDIVKLFQLPEKGITINDGFFQCAALDSHATPTAVCDLRVTDGTTTKTIISGMTTTVTAGGLSRPSKAPATETAIGFTTDNKNYWVELKYTTAAATVSASAAITVGLSVSGYYPAGAVTE